MKKFIEECFKLAEKHNYYFIDYSNSDNCVIICGNNDKMNKELESIIKKYKLDNKIVVTDGIHTHINLPIALG